MSHQGCQNSIGSLGHHLYCSQNSNGVSSTGLPDGILPTSASFWIQTGWHLKLRAIIQLCYLTYSCGEGMNSCLFQEYFYESERKEFSLATVFLRIITATLRAHFLLLFNKVQFDLIINLRFCFNWNIF